MRAVSALAALIALTVACGGNTPTSPTLPPNPLSGSGLTPLNRGFVRATIDGVRWESTTPVGGIGPSFAGAPPLLTLAASAGSASPLAVLIGGPVAVGTYESGGASLVNFTLSELFGNSWSASPLAPGSTGRLTITAATPTRVAGTFSFTAIARTQGVTPATRTVTDGSFDVSQ